MTALVLGIDPEPLGVAPFVMTSRGRRRCSRPTSGWPCTRAPGPWSSRRWGRTSEATSSRACSPPAWTATSGPGCSSTSAPTARSCSATATPSCRPRRRPARPSRAARSAAACGPPTAPSRSCASTRTACSLQVIGDVEPQGLCGSGLVDAVSELVRAGLLDSSGRFVPDERAHEIAPEVADRLTASARSGSSCCTGPTGRTRRRDGVPLPARRPRAPVRQGRHRHRLDAAARGAGPGAVRRAAGAAGRLVRQLPLPRGGRPDRAGAEDPGAAHRLGRQRRGRGREDEPAQSSASARAPWPCWRR